MNVNYSGKQMISRRAARHEATARCVTAAMAGLRKQVCRLSDRRDETHAGCVGPPMRRGQPTSGSLAVACHYEAHAVFLRKTRCGTEKEADRRTNGHQIAT